jgi:hypothetical protein
LGFVAPWPWTGCCAARTPSGANATSELMILLFDDDLIVNVRSFPSDFFAHQ